MTAAKKLTSEYMRGFDEGQWAAHKDFNEVNSALVLERLRLKEALVRLGWTPTWRGMVKPEGWVGFDCDVPGPK